MNIVAEMYRNPEQIEAHRRDFEMHYAALIEGEQHPHYGGRLVVKKSRRFKHNLWENWLIDAFIESHPEAFA